MGSSEATITRLIPACRIASVHGGVLPSWQHGSSDTYSVAPLRSATPQASIALTSACTPPNCSCQPSPNTSPSRATTAPTTGLGLTAPNPLPASSIARSRCAWSVSVQAVIAFRISPGDFRTGHRAAGTRSFLALADSRQGGSSQSSSRSQTPPDSARANTVRRDRPLRPAWPAPCSRRSPAAPPLDRQTPARPAWSRSRPNSRSDSRSSRSARG